MTTKTQAKNKTGKLDVLEKTKTTKTVYIKRYSQKGKKKNKLHNGRKYLQNIYLIRV